MKQLIQRPLILLTLLLLGGGLVTQHLPSFAHAQEEVVPVADPNQPEVGFSVSVTPSTGFLRIKPGDSAVHTIWLRNQGDQTITVRPKLVDFTTDGLSGDPQLADLSNFLYLDNPQILNQELVILPKTQASLGLAIAPPASAPTKEYWLTVLFEQQASLDATGVSALMPTIGSNLVVLVSSDNIPPKLRISTLQTPRFIDSFRPLEIRPIAQNESDGASVASGSAVIKDWRGQVVAELPIYPDVVLGNTGRELRAAKPAAPVLPTDPKAAYAPKLEPIPFSVRRPMLLGTYTVEIDLNLDGEAGQSTTTQQFTLFAFPIVATVVVVATGFVTAVTLVVSKKKRRARDEQATISP